MGKNKKTWLVTVYSLVFVGCLIFGGTMHMIGQDLTKLSTFKYETNEYIIDKEFINISVETDTADIKFFSSNDGKTTVKCYEQENLKHSASVIDGVLTIKVVDERKWYEYIGIGFSSPKISVYIPQEEYGSLSIKSDTGAVEISEDFKFTSIDILESTGDVKNFASASGAVNIKTSTGDIYVENVTASSLELTASTGRIYLSDITCTETLKTKVSTGKIEALDVKCKTFTSNGNTGDITLKSLVANERITIERSTGNVVFDACDAGELFIKTDTGNIKGTLLTEKVFIVSNDTGRIDVPKTVNGGRCEITTDTGDIKISIN